MHSSCKSFNITVNIHIKKGESVVNLNLEGKIDVDMFWWKVGSFDDISFLVMDKENQILPDLWRNFRHFYHKRKK